MPIEAYPPGREPSLIRHIERANLAEELGFTALWLRDVPFNVPSFGDVGQIFDPFVYLGALAASTSEIGLGVASIILPLRHPAHVAKAAASADALSNGRLLLGTMPGILPWLSGRSEGFARARVGDHVVWMGQWLRSVTPDCRTGFRSATDAGRQARS